MKPNAAVSKNKNPNHSAELYFVIIKALCTSAFFAASVIKLTAELTEKAQYAETDIILLKSTFDKALLTRPY
jgi:hypothetical protein